MRAALDRTQRRNGRQPAAHALLASALAICLASHGVATAQDVHAKINDLTGAVKPITIALTQGTNMAATASPDGRFVAFTNQSVLWVVPVEGGRARRISGWDVEATAPTWSPDGKSIAFQNYDGAGFYHIWTVAPDGSDAKQVTSGPYDDRDPSWSLDGKGLIFASDRSADTNYKIWRYDVATGAYAQLTSGAGAESNPALSPDGRKLLYVENGPKGGVMMKDLANGEVSLVAADAGFPSWTSTGLIAFQTSVARDRRDNRTPVLPNQPEKAQTIQIGEKVFASGEDFFPFPVVNLPNGRMLYTADGNINIRSDDGQQSRIVPFRADLELRRPVFDRKKDHRFGQYRPRAALGIQDPMLSPDGRMVAFAALNDIWVMDIAKGRVGRPRAITDGTDAKGKPAWIPDGKHVYFSTDKDGGGFLAVDQVDIDTRERKRLAAAEGVAMNDPMLSPSGRTIAYWTGNGRLELYDLTVKARRPILDPAHGAAISRPSWSADETKVAVTDARRANNRFREAYNTIRVIDVTDKSARWYPIGGALDVIADRSQSGPVWSPNGRFMAFVSDAVLQVMPVHPDGSPAGKPVRLTADAADMPTWSADSRSLVYMASDRMKVMTVATGMVRDITPKIEYAQKVADGLTIVHANVWTGLQATLLPDRDVVISSNRIIAIEPHGTRAPSTAARYIDAAGKTLMPGLWDSHVHSLYFGHDILSKQMAENLADGITSVFSMGNYLYADLNLRESLEAGKLVGPRLFATGDLNDGIRTNYPSAVAIKDVGVAEILAAKYRRTDVDSLKLYVRAPIPVMAVIARTAHELGIPSYGHFLSPAIEAGMSGSAHLFATERMGYGWSSTTKYQDVMALRTKGDFALVVTDGTPLNAPLVRAGATVAAGTDMPLRPSGTQTHINLQNNARYVGNFEALKMVTINSAINAFADKDLGSVEVGKVADLIVVDGDPLQDVAVAAKVVYVIKNGRVTTPAEIRAPFETPQRIAEANRAQTAHANVCRLDQALCEPSYMAGD